MKKSLSIVVSIAILAMYLSISFVSCTSESGLKKELTKYYQSEWSRLSDNFSEAHFKAQALQYMNTMADCPYPVATDRDAVAQKLAALYCKERLNNDLASMALPYFSNKISVVEFKRINNTISDEKALSIVKKIADITQNDLRKLIEEQTSTTVASIMNGEEPNIPTLSEELRAGYLPTMEKFYIVSGRKAIIENSFTAVNDIMAEGAPESRILAESFFDYISRATPVLMCMTMEGKVSEEELNTLIEIYERPEFVKLREANIEYSQEIIKADAGVNQLFLDWLKKKL